MIKEWMAFGIPELVGAGMGLRRWPKAPSGDETVEKST
jgi:hypothetical protein